MPGLKDFIADPFRATLPPQGPISTPGGFIRGPSASPVKMREPNPEDMSAQQLLAAILGKLQTNNDDLIRAWRTAFPSPSRESIPIFDTAAYVNIPTGGADTDVVTFSIPSKYTGFITHAGFQVNGNGGYENILWSLKIGQDVHPSLSRQAMYVSTLATPYPFQFEAIQGRNYHIMASNQAGTAITVSAVIIGWMERMSEARNYGAQSSSGIG